MVLTISFYIVVTDCVLNKTHMLCPIAISILFYVKVFLTSCCQNIEG